VKPCDWCAGNGCVPSDYNWELLRCERCGGAGQVPGIAPDGPFNAQIDLRIEKRPDGYFLVAAIFGHEPRVIERIPEAMARCLIDQN